MTAMVRPWSQITWFGSPVADQIATFDATPNP